MGIWIKRIFKGMNKGAFGGRLTCPVCHSEAVRFIENITRFRLRYRCRKCGLRFQYDISNAPAGLDGGAHPYAAYKTNKYRRIVDTLEQGRKK